MGVGNMGRSVETPLDRYDILSSGLYLPYSPLINKPRGFLGYFTEVSILLALAKFLVITLN